MTTLVKEGRFAGPFKEPLVVRVDLDFSLLVTDRVGNKIRRVTLTGNEGS